MWRLGFFFHEIAFGLLSIFLPLHIIAVGGSLVHIGIMATLALFLAIPASFFWGYLSDKTRHYKRFVLLSFLSATILLYLFTFVTDVSLLITLYVIMAILLAAHEAPKNVLIAELYPHEEWTRAFAIYEGFVETGKIVGLLLGFLISAYSFSATSILLLTSSLNLIAFVLSLVFLADPLLVFERSLVGIEKTVEFASRGVFLASRMFDGLSVNEKLRRENVSAFCLGLVFFSLASSIFFTPLPIFISSLTTSAALPSSIIFIVFVLNSAGNVVGYVLARNRQAQTIGKANLSRTVLLRSFLAFSFITVIVTPIYNVPTATIILMLMGFAYALFLVYTLSLSMELIPAGKAGLFNVLVGIGGACGSFIGSYVAQTFGFLFVFATAGAVFLLAAIAFQIFT
jgi:MFS family permease